VCGYDNWPSQDIVNNQTWALLAAMAFNLLSRAQRLTLTGPYQSATPKTIRQRLLHIAGRITPSGRRRLHLDSDWPWTPTLLAGIHNTNTLTNHHAA
ncbi:MAG: transposase, partial [Acidimicrobiia bacterium]|nr:transposase [Acidimicrobiia bacterium]